MAALGVAYERTGAFGRARHFFNRSLAKSPDNFRAVTGLAELTRREGKTTEAKRMLEQFVKRHPDNPWGLTALGTICAERGKPQLERAMEKVPNTPSREEKEVKALAAWRSGRLKEAIRLYSDLVKEKTCPPGVLCDYAQVLIASQKPEQAKSILYRTLRDYPNSLLARRLLASIYIRDNDYVQGEAWLRKAFAMDPKNTEILRDLGFVQQVRRKFWSSQKNWLEGGRRKIRFREIFGGWLKICYQGPVDVNFPVH